MPQGSDLLELIVIPYYAHNQAKISGVLSSIAWNKVALTGYIDILLLAKEITPPSGFLRKIRSFYEYYEKAVNNTPLLGELESLFRALNQLDKTNPKAVTTFALKWHATIQALEQLCMENIAMQKLGNRQQICEALQTMIFALQESATLPHWDLLLDQQQFEISKYVQLKNHSSAALQRFNLKTDFAATFHTDKEQVRTLMKEDPEIGTLIQNLNKNFLRLVYLINNKLPEPERHLKVNPTEHELTVAQDYCLTFNYFYNGRDEGEYETNFFTRLRTLLK